MNSLRTGYSDFPAQIILKALFFDLLSSQHPPKNRLEKNQSHRLNTAAILRIIIRLFPPPIFWWLLLMFTLSLFVFSRADLRLHLFVTTSFISSYNFLSITHTHQCVSHAPIHVCIPCQAFSVIAKVINSCVKSLQTFPRKPHQRKIEMLAFS